MSLFGGVLSDWLHNVRGWRLVEVRRFFQNLACFGVALPHSPFSRPFRRHFSLPIVFQIMSAQPALPPSASSLYGLVLSAA